MATVIARNSITISTIIDISAYYRYYKLQSSTSNPPSKPTSINTLPPSGWSDTEPSYTEGSTNSLYFVDLTVYSDDTFEYSEVSLSSAYEAAKQAYNKATNAQTTANNVNTRVDNLDIGGRNLLLDTENMYKWSPQRGASIDDGVVTYISVSSNVWREVTTSFGLPYSNIRNKTVTVSCYVKAANGTRCGINLCLGVSGYKYTYNRRNYRNNHVYFTGTDDWEKISVKIDITDAYFSSGSGSDFENGNINFWPGAINTYHNGFQAKKFKLEIGEYATDWSPAPEDAIKGDGQNMFINTYDTSMISNGRYSRPMIKNQATYTYFLNDISIVPHGIRETVVGSYPIIRFGTGSASTETLNGMEAGETYTLSFDCSYSLFGSGTALPLNYTAYFCVYLCTNSSGTLGQTYRHQIHTYDAEDTSDRGQTFTKHVELTYTVPDNATQCYLMIRDDSATSNRFVAGDFIEVRNLMLEKGINSSGYIPSSYDLEHISYGSGNLFINSDTFDGWATNESANIEIIASINNEVDEDGAKIVHYKTKTGETTWRFIANVSGDDGANIPYAKVRNKRLTLSYYVKFASASDVDDENILQIQCALCHVNSTTRTRYTHNMNPRSSSSQWSVTTDWQRIYFTFELIDDYFLNVVNGATIDPVNDRLFIQFYNHSLKECWIKKPMLTIGTIVEDWSPQVAFKKEVEEAKKVANNYISTDNTGLMVADLTNGTQTPSQATGKNVLIGSTSVDIRNGQTVLASYGAETTIGNRKELGNNYILLDNDSLELNRVTDVSNPNSIVSESIFAIGINDAQNPFEASWIDSRFIAGNPTNGTVISFVSEHLPFTQVYVYVRDEDVTHINSVSFIYGTAGQAVSSTDSNVKVVYDGDTTFTFYGSSGTIYLMSTKVVQSFVGVPAFAFGEHLINTHPNQLIVGSYNDNGVMSTNAPFIVANGTATDRNNLFTVYNTGTAYLGNEYVKTFENDVLGKYVNAIDNSLEVTNSFIQLGENIICSGLITESKKEVRFSYVLPQRFSDELICDSNGNLNAVNITELTVIMRHCGGGYIGTSTSVSSSAINVTSRVKSATIQAENILTIVLEYTSAWKTNSGTLNNNTPVAVNVRSLMFDWQIDDSE